jgi:hypothetical protein
MVKTIFDFINIFFKIKYTFGVFWY